MEPMYEGEPILAVAAVDELTAAEAIEKIQIEYEPLPFAVDPIASLRPGSANARDTGQRLDAATAASSRRGGGARAARRLRQAAQGAAGARGAAGCAGRAGAWRRRSSQARRKDAAASSPRAGSCPGAWRRTGGGAGTRRPRRCGAALARPEVEELKWTDEDFADGRRPAAARQAHRRVAVRRPRGRLQGRGARARRDLGRPEHQPPGARAALGDGLLAERQAVPARRHAEHRADRAARSRAGSASTSQGRRPHQRVHAAAASAAASPATSRWRFRRCCRRRPTRR